MCGAQFYDHMWVSVAQVMVFTQLKILGARNLIQDISPTGGIWVASSSLTGSVGYMMPRKWTWSSSRNATHWTVACHEGSKCFGAYLGFPLKLI